MGASIDAMNLDRLIGRNLVSLDLFPDELWRKFPKLSKRRLTQNVLHAELASSHASDLDQDKLAQECERTDFRSLEGEELDKQMQRHWRKICAGYCLNPERKLRDQIPYGIFEQLFIRDLKGLKLGERVEREIDQSSPGRVDEFRRLDVKAGLDRRDRDDAQKFLEEEPEREDENAQRDLLSKQTRRMVEKAAFPTPEKFENPLIKIAQVTRIMRERNEAREGNLTVEMRLGRNANDKNPSIGLLAFLYGATLRAVAEASKLAVDGIELNIDPRLCTPIPVPALVEEIEDEDDSGVQELWAWEAVPVEFALLSGNENAEIDVEAALEWHPSSIDRLALFWLLTCAEDRPKPTALLALPPDMTFEGWIADAVSRVGPLSTCAREEIGPEILRHATIAKLIAGKISFEEEARKDGLSIRLLGSAFDPWDLILQYAKQTFIPEGKSDPHLQAMLRFECLLGRSGKNLLMLASHPLRLRWLEKYLRKSEELAVKSLEERLPLNSQNEAMYLNWISNLSPQQQPAIHISPAGELLLATGETGWTEEFSPPRNAPGSEINESISPVRTGEIIAQIIAYLEAHPYKMDGLTILIVSAKAPRFAADLVTNLRRGDWSGMSLTVHLATPRKLWEEATRHFEDVPAENRMISGNVLFPPVQLRLHDYNTGHDTSEMLINLKVDLSIVPEFFHGSFEVQENTEPNPDDEGSFDPLLDRPTFIYGGKKGGAISVSQRPRNPDPTLAAWSTIVVRQHRLKPVAQQQPENIDFLELRISFQQASRLFVDLHRISHWVITLERYITREQIEELDSRPEILTVRDRVGPGGMFTLIVSSNAGRKFIVRRLERKLTAIVQKLGGGHMAAARVNRDLAIRIYDETRQIAPRLTLKAMGIARVSEEILGLAVGRHLLEGRFPAPVESGLVAWISLDEHPDWFGGISATRADLCRITLEQTQNGLNVDVLILESKLRLAGFDPHGVEQVARTMSLFRDMMPGSDGQYEFMDAQLWRENLLSAIEVANTDAVDFYGDLVEQLDNEPHRIPVEIRNKFRDGDFVLRDLKGIYSICTYGQSVKHKVEKALGHRDITIIQSSGSDLLSLVADSAAEEGNGSEEGSGNKRPREREVAEGGNKQAERAGAVTEPMRRGKLTREELERHYQTILDTYAEFDIPVHKPEDPADQFVEGPASVLYRIRRGHGVDPKRISEKVDTLGLNLKLAEGQKIRFSMDRGLITIDVPKTTEDRYFVDAKDLWRRWKRPEDQLCVPLGEDRFGEPVAINFSSPNSPHLLIGGTTGSGKSEALNTILSGLINHYSSAELRLLLVDPKGSELQHYETDAHLEGDIGWDDEDARAKLERAVGEMQRRYQLFREAGTRTLPEYNGKCGSEDRIPWWFIVLDEYADLTSDIDAKKTLESQLKRLAQKARASGIHIVIATQKPSADVISTNLRSNLPTQLALRVKSQTESRVVMDEVGAETLNGMGDAFLKSEGKLIRVQCAKC